MSFFSKEVAAWLKENEYASAGADDAELKEALDGALKDGALTYTKIAEMQKASADIALEGLADKVEAKLHERAEGGVTPSEVFSGSGAGRVNVKALDKQFSTKRYAAKHEKTGESVHFRGKEIEMPSEYDCARAGALFKHRAKRSGVDVILTDRDKQLVAEMYNKDTWCGQIGGVWSNEIPPSQVKGLLNDTGSGGTYIDPLWYDEAVITYPLLFGELLPLVDLVEVPRGTTIDSAGIGNPTVSWSTAEGTSIPLFDTTAMIQAINSSAFPVTLALTVGRDLLSDSVVDLGRYILENIGQASAHEMDKIIGTGDGVTQPQGITNASGLTNVVNTSGVGAPMSWGIYESLYFGLSKQYRKNGMRNCFISSDSTYANFHSIPVGPNDARRLAGQDSYASYTAMGEPYRICQELPDTTIIFGAMSRYRLYRRQGSETRIVTEGQTLALTNQILMVMRGRYGGRVMDPAAFAVMTNAPAA